MPTKKQEANGQRFEMPQTNGQMIPQPKQLPMTPMPEMPLSVQTMPQFTHVLMDNARSIMEAMQPFMGEQAAGCMEAEIEFYMEVD